MAKVIERNVPIAEENVTLSGQPATNMFEDWSEEMTDKAENPYDEKSDVPHDKEERKKCLKEMYKIVKDDIAQTEYGTNRFFIFFGKNICSPKENV